MAAGFSCIFIPKQREKANTSGQVTGHCPSITRNASIPQRMMIFFELLPINTYSIFYATSARLLMVEYLYDDNRKYNF